MKVKVDDIVASRELDYFLAEKFENKICSECDNFLKTLKPTKCYLHGGVVEHDDGCDDLRFKNAPAYTTSVDAALGLCERLGRFYIINSDRKILQLCVVSNKKRFLRGIYRDSSNLPIELCRLILKLQGIEEIYI